MKPVLGVLALLLLAIGSVWLRGCHSSRPPIHLNPNMDRQPQYLPQRESRFFANGSVDQPRVPGTLARGRLREDESYTAGKSFWSGYLQQVPFAVTDDVVDRGHQRFDIFCAPCHGTAGNGVSPLTLRTGLTTANLLEPKFAAYRPGKLFEVITKGSGLMPGYRESIGVDDRWMIVAYLDRLQQSASAGDGGHRP